MTRGPVRETLGEELRRVERTLDRAREENAILERELEERRAWVTDKEELCIQLRRALS